jgi:hypothetical protein
MGLIEHQEAGAAVGRNSVTITSTAGYKYYTGSTPDFKRTFILLNAAPSIYPSRVRLYMNSSSRNLISEISRSFETKSINDYVGLIADVSFSANGNVAFGFDPMLYGASLDPGYKIYYTIETPGNVANSITFSTFLLEDELESDPTSQYSISNRRTIKIQTTTLPSASRYINSASIVSASSGATKITTSAPKSYLLLSASSFPNIASQSCRVRLYSIPTTGLPQSEITRSFSELPNTGSGLIVDFLMESGSIKVPFQPISFGANVETVLTSQNLLDTPVSNTIYYIVDSLESAASQHNIEIDIYSLED